MTKYHHMFGSADASSILQGVMDELNLDGQVALIGGLAGGSKMMRRGKHCDFPFLT